MRHVSAISGYLISIDFLRLIGCRRDPRVLGCHINCRDIISIVLLDNLHALCYDIDLIIATNFSWLS